MRRLRLISPRSLFAVDEQTLEWMSFARTPQTRAEIRRWARWEALSFWILAAGGISVLALPVLGIGLSVWSLLENDDAVFWWSAVPLATTMALFIIGGALGSRAKVRRLTAMYADGQSTVGRLDDVVVQTGGGDDQPVYDFLITAELPGPISLRRTLYWGQDDSGLPPQRWIGRAIRFRHNSLDPDDLHDVRFDGWTD